MSDRIKGFVVVLDADIHIDDAEPIADAIRQLRHVSVVEASTWNNEDLMNRSRIRTEIEQKLWAVLRPPKQDRSSP